MLFFFQSAALKRVTEEKKELKCSLEAERRRSTGKKLDKNKDVLLITN